MIQARAHRNTVVLVVMKTILWVVLILDFKNSGFQIFMNSSSPPNKKTISHQIWIPNCFHIVGNWVWILYEWDPRFCSLKISLVRPCRLCFGKGFLTVFLDIGSDIQTLTASTFRVARDTQRHKHIQKGTHAQFLYIDGLNTSLVLSYNQSRIHPLCVREHMR